jgi:hypothetical protein
VSQRTNKKFGSGNNFSDKGKPDLLFERELKEMPDHSNAATRETEDRLGPFVFDRPELASQ